MAGQQTVAPATGGRDPSLRTLVTSAMDPGAISPGDRNIFEGLDPAQIEALDGMLEAAARSVGPALIPRPPSPDGTVSVGEDLAGRFRYQPEQYRIAPWSGFANRTREKRAEQVITDVRDLYLGSFRLERSVRSYNTLGRNLAPGLWSQIEELARKEGVPVDQIVRKVLDPNNPASQYSALRQEMSGVAEKPEMRAALEDVVASSQKQNVLAHRVSESIRTMAPEMDPAALEALNEAIQETVGERMRQLPDLEGGIPGDKANGAVDEAKGGFQRSAEQIKAAVDAIMEKLQALVGRKAG